MWAEYPEIGKDMAVRTEGLEANAPFNQRMIQAKIDATKNQLLDEAKARARVGSDSDDMSSSSVRACVCVTHLFTCRVIHCDV